MTSSQENKPTDRQSFSEADWSDTTVWSALMFSAAAAGLRCCKYQTGLGVRWRAADFVPGLLSV